jgi:hypothetical protein
MFRGQGFQYSTVKVQSNTKPAKPDAIVLRRRTPKLFPTISPSLVLVIGVAVAGIAVRALGLLG